MTKVYGYPGKACVVAMIPAGKTYIKCEFTDGYLDSKIARPARFKTDDKVIQMIIENSPMFGKSIFLYDSYGEEEVETIEIDEEETALIEYPNVTTYEEAVAVLKAIPGVKVTQLRSASSAKKVAAINGIVFPNYNFE